MQQSPKSSLTDSHFFQHGHRRIETVHHNDRYLNYAVPGLQNL
jgi:hypothetical protein